MPISDMENGVGESATREEKRRKKVSKSVIRGKL